MSPEAITSRKGTALGLMLKVAPNRSLLEAKGTTEATLTVSNRTRVAQAHVTHGDPVEQTRWSCVYSRDSCGLAT